LWLILDYLDSSKRSEKSVFYGNESIEFIIFFMLNYRKRPLSQTRNSRNKVITIIDNTTKIRMWYFETFYKVIKLSSFDFFCLHFGGTLCIQNIVGQNILYGKSFFRSSKIKAATILALMTLSDVNTVNKDLEDSFSF